MRIEIAPRILEHPWYRKWECGELPKESLQHYASEYYWHVSAFPRYLSRLHSQLDDLKMRQVLLRNLLDEENEQEPHQELWAHFAEALGTQSLPSPQAPGPAAHVLVQSFQGLMDQGVPEGLGALLAYESQIPEVARFKSKALRDHYLSKEEADRGTRFFTVHEQADVWHTQELETLLSSLSPEELKRAQQGATQACVALWGFLDAMPH